MFYQKAEGIVVVVKCVGFVNFHYLAIMHMIMKLNKLLLVKLSALIC